MAIFRRKNKEEKDRDQRMPSPRAPISKFIWKLVSEQHEFAPLSEKSLQNLAEANKVLKDKALVVYINHTSMSDAAVAISLILSHLTNAVRFMGPAGMKHYDFSRDPKSALLLRSLKILNIHAIPVIQHDDLDHYPAKKRELLTNRLKQKTKKMLRQRGAIYGIAPEGKRNADGTLLQARPGIGKLEKISRYIHYLPVAITYNKFSEKPEVVVGKPETLGELISDYDVLLPRDEAARAQKIADVLMYNLSRLLPKDLRGYYKDLEI